MVPALKEFRIRPGREPLAPACPTSVLLPHFPPPLPSSGEYSKQIPRNCPAQQLTCVKVEHSSCLPLHGDHPALALDVGCSGPPVVQNDLKQLPAALHSRHHGVPHARLNVHLVGVERLVEDSLHYLEGEGKRLESLGLIIQADKTVFLMMILTISQETNGTSHNWCW